MRTDALHFLATQVCEKAWFDGRNMADKAQTFMKDGCRNFQGHFWLAVLLLLPGAGASAGVPWSLTSAPANYWVSVASSLDGIKLVAVCYMGPKENIYTSQAVPAPQLCVASGPSNALISWTIPSTNFVLQQNADLTTTNWSNVTDAPARNFSTLQDQVTVSPSASCNFYRLVTP